MHSREQTIFALSSGRPPTAIAVVRVSGPQAGRALEMLAGKLPRPRHATHVLLHDSDRQPIDDAVVLWFPSPASATGEDVAEFHLHGSRAVIAALFEAFGKFEDMRAAEPGEFTRRAFENGKLDLTEAEGLDDLIHADTDRQRRQALRQLKGLLGNKAESWRQQIIDACALIEAGIDFSDEGDVPSELIAPALLKIDALKNEIEETIAAQGQSERLRDGLTIAIAGPPNAGKSTLLNRLAKRDAAIVSPHAGTTRDVIEVHLDLDGYPVTLLDTAGVRDTDDPVEQEGVRRARERTRGADLVLWMIDATADDAAAATIDGAPNEAPIWLLRNKADLLMPHDASVHQTQMSFDVSAARGDGVEHLLDALVKYAGEFFGAGEAAIITRARHRMLLQQTVVALGQAQAMSGQGDELIAEELRIAVQRLGELTGRVDVEHVLGAIFSKFCVGK